MILGFLGPIISKNLSSYVNYERLLSVLSLVKNNVFLLLLVGKNRLVFLFCLVSIFGKQHSHPKLWNASWSVPNEFQLGISSFYYSYYN